MPNFIQLITPITSIYQNVDYCENLSIKIYHFDYLVLLEFLYDCILKMQTVQPRNTDKDFELATVISQVELKLVYQLAKDQFLLIISNDNSKFEFDNKTIPDFLSALSKLIFKSYSYSHNINYAVSTFVKEAQLNLIKSPSYQLCFAIFEKIECIQVDYFLLYDIILRHKDVLVYVKRFNQIEDE